MNSLYGRTELLAEARATLERALSGHGRLLLFTGEPGIGKSRLMEQLAEEAASRGARVAWGRCWEAGGAPAYWPWMQVFRSLGQDDDPFAGAADDLALGKAEARFAVFDRAARGLLASATSGPLLIVLDDLHAADAPSLLLLLMLSRELRRAPLLVIGAYRDAELQTASEVAASLAKLAREAEVRPLTRLATEHISAWLRDIAPEADSAAAAQLYRMTEGHPLFVVETLRLGISGEGRTSWTLGPRAVLDERLNRLSEPTRSVLAVAAVLGREFERGQLAAVAELSEDDVHAALGEALRTSIVVATAPAERYRFSHVLLRDRLYHDMLPSLRARLHFRIGQRAVSRGDAQGAAHHLFEGAAAGPFQTIAEVALAAAEAALSRLAFEDAARLAQRALAAPEAAALPGALRGTLQVVAAEALIRLGDNAAGQLLCLEAAGTDAAAADPVLLARTALAYATELATGAIDPEMIALLRRALAAHGEGDSALRSRLLARLCAALTPPSDNQQVAEILELMQGALGMARRLGDRHALLYVLQFAATVGLLVPEQERFSLLEESLALARALRQPLVMLQVLPPYLTQLIALGGASQAAAMLPEYRELLGESRQPGHRIRFVAVCALIATLRGDHAAVEDLHREARALIHGTGPSGPRFVWVMHRIGIAELQEAPALLLEDAMALDTRVKTAPSMTQYYAWFLAGTGRADQARERLRASDLSETGMSFPKLWELHAAAETCVLLGDVEFGERLYPLALRAADRAFWTLGPGAILGPATRALGDLALLIGRVDAALSHYAQAIVDSEKLGAQWLAERCRARLQAARARALPPGEAPTSPLPRATPPRFTLVREGDVWAIHSRDGTTQRVKHGKGLSYLQRLVERPGQELHVLELAGVEHRTGDAGPLLDPAAKAAYGARLAVLREEADEATRACDLERQSRAQREIDAIAEQLARAVGLGGRDRRAASDVERVRINVQRRLKDAIDRIAAVDPELGRYLTAAVKTGTSCVFTPL